MQNHTLFIFGFGYTAGFLAKRLVNDQWQILGTSREAKKQDRYAKLGYRLMNPTYQDLLMSLKQASHIIMSIPPQEDGSDIGIECLQQVLSQPNCKIQYLAYLSTTGVYGDHQGNWVDENTPVNPNSQRAKRRVQAEEEWLALGKAFELPTFIFRLAGIYGPKRNSIMQIQHGKDQALYKKDQYFSRIHVEDIANILDASLNQFDKAGIYNVCDDLPCGSHEVLEYAAELLNKPLPQRVPIEQAQLTSMQAEFYADNRRVKNQKIKTELGVELRYPTYKQGLKALLENP